MGVVSEHVLIPEKLIEQSLYTVRVCKYLTLHYQLLYWLVIALALYLDSLPESPDRQDSTTDLVIFVHLSQLGTTTL